MSITSSILDSAEKTDEAAVQIRVESKLNGPVKDLSWLGKSLLFAELSRLSYFSESIIQPLLQEMGITECRFVDRDGAQAYIFGNDDDCFVVCRGTEPHEWNDVRADAYAWTVLTEVGRLHAGFNTEVNDLWPMLEKQLRENKRSTWFAGHSLGGAMATISAGRCKLSQIPTNPLAIFTFGSPRVGNRKYINYVKIPHFRWVNNNDIVPRVPPAWLGYRHTGSEIYLNSRGVVRELAPWIRFRDQVRGLLASLRLWQIDYFTDHSTLNYIEHISRAYRLEREQGTTPKLRNPVVSNSF